MSLFSRLFRKDWRELPFADVAPRIKASITAEQLSPEIVERELGDLRAALAIDVEGAPQFVEQRDVRRWSKQPDELWTLARENLASDPALLLRPYRAPIEEPSEVVVQLITSENEFAAGRLLLLDRTGVGPQGALVAVPVRNAALFLPLPDAVATVALPVMVMMAAPMFDEGPGSVSPHLFWYRAGAFAQVTTRASPHALPKLELSGASAQLEAVLLQRPPSDAQ